MTSWSDVTVAIPTVLPARAAPLADLVGQVAEHCPGALLVISPHVPGEPAKVDFPRVLEAAARAGRPWILQLEDDAHLCPGFRDEALAVDLHEIDALTLFSRTGADMTALELGHKTRRMSPKSFSMTQGFFLRASLAMGIDSFAKRFYEEHPEHNRGADLLLGAYLSSLRARVLVRIPSLVQHRHLPSTLPNHRGARQSETYRRAFGELPEDMLHAP
jgi:hypothetical protein